MHNTEHRPLVYICSPFAGDIQQNTENARRYCRFAIEHGAIPFAPHLLYPQFMNDKSLCDREIAIDMGLQMLDICDELWVFGRKISSGMRREIDYAQQIGKPVQCFTSYVAKSDKQLHTDAHWIPCSERMPEELKDVLVYIPDWCCIAIAIWCGDCWLEQWTDGIAIKDAVTHWMPLPEPPKNKLEQCESD